MSSVSRVMFFVGSLLLLMGMFGFARVIHVDMRQVPYPSSGVLPSNVLFSGSDFARYSGRESDCNPFPIAYYEDDNKTPRDATNEEKMLDENLYERCVQGFDEVRSKTRQYDRNLSAFLVFVGAGLIFTRRFLD